MDRIETGFWKQAIGPWDILEYEYTESGEELYKYLHGFCDVFAFALHQKFGYNLEYIFHRDTEEDNHEDGRWLIHAYCTTIINDIKYYIDVRGVQTDFNEFICDFEDEYDPYDDDIYFVNVSKPLEGRAYNNEWYVSTDASAYIAKHEDYYKIPQTKQEVA